MITVAEPLSAALMTMFGLSLSSLIACLSGWVIFGCGLISGISFMFFSSFSRVFSIFPGVSGGIQVDGSRNLGLV